MIRGSVDTFIVSNWFGFISIQLFVRTNVTFSLHVFRSELIQLVTVTQKRAEASYKELIEQQIQMYQRR